MRSPQMIGALAAQRLHLVSLMTSGARVFDMRWMAEEANLKVLVMPRVVWPERSGMIGGVSGNRLNKSFGMKIVVFVRRFSAVIEDHDMGAKSPESAFHTQTRSRECKINRPLS
jgi:hypothetical protein